MTYNIVIPSISPPPDSDLTICGFCFMGMMGLVFIIEAFALKGDNEWNPDLTMMCLIGIMLIAFSGIALLTEFGLISISIGS